MDRLLTRKEVESLIKLSRSSIYTMLSLGKFVTPIRVGKRAIRFSEREVQAWVDARR